MEKSVQPKSVVASLSLAHLLNDWYNNYIQTLLPFLVAAGLGVSKGAFLISAFTITSSLLQPYCGYLVDQKNQRWMVYVGTFWMAVLICLVGLLKSYPLLLISAALAGVGTAAFHPQASSMVTAVSGNRKGFFQACFVASGNIGLALTPLVIVPFVESFGLENTFLFMLPGIAVAGLLWFSAPKDAVSRKSVPSPLLPALRANWAELTKLVLVVVLRSLAYFGLIAFLPLYLKGTGTSLLTSSRLLFTMLMAGAVGGMIGGTLSDAIGRKQVIAWSLILSCPLFYLFLHTTGWLSYALLTLAGAALLSSFSVTIVVAQEIISKNASMASGLMLGFSVGLGGLGVGLLGLMAEWHGLPSVINLVIWFPLLGGLLSLTMRSKKPTP